MAFRNVETTRFVTEHFRNQFGSVRSNLFQIWWDAMMFTENGVAGTDMLLEFDGKLSLFFLTDQEWLNLLEKFSRMAAPHIPLIPDSMIFVPLMHSVVSGNETAKLVVQRTDRRVVNHPKQYLQLLATICFGTVLACGNMEFVHANTSFSVKQPCDISQMHVNLLSECWNGGEFGGTPDRTTPSQAEGKTSGVCNEQVPPPKGKICSVLHGNMQSAAEMTAPSDMHNYNISESNKQDQRYSDWDVLDISQSDVISAAEYQWRQIALNVVASGRELRINAGEEQIIDLAKARIKNAIRTFANSFSSDLYSAGSLTNQVNGLQAIIADTNTNTVGGINATNFSFWRNTVRDASDASVTTSATTIENGMMLPLWLSISRGAGDEPDLIVFDTVYYTYFEGSQVSLKRYMNKDSANAGFGSLMYKSAEVLFDTSATGIPASHGYMINSNYMELVVHRDADLEVMDDMRPINQDGSVTPVLWMGNLVCSNRALQGVMIE